MSAGAPIYRPPSWLDAVSKDRSFFDPRTYEVHRTTFTAPPSRWPRQPARQPSGAHQTCLTPQPQRLFITNWVQTNMVALEKSAFAPVPVEDIEDIYDAKLDDDSDDDSISTLGSGPIRLEALPPYPKRGPDNSLFGLHNQLRQNAVIPYDLTPTRVVASHDRPEFNVHNNNNNNSSSSSSSSSSNIQGRQSASAEFFDDTLFPGYIGAECSSSNHPYLDSSAWTSSSDGNTTSSDASGGQCTDSRKLIVHEIDNATRHCVKAFVKIRRKLRC